MTGISVGGMGSQWSVGGNMADMSNVSNMSEVSVVLNGAGGQMTDMTDSRMANGVGSWGVHLVDGSSVSVHLMVDGSGVDGMDSMDSWGGVGNVNGGSMDGMSVNGRGGLGDDGVESVHIIGSIVDGSDRTVSLDQGVLSLYDISIADLMLGLDITGVTVRNSIVERVLGVRVLKLEKNY